jgi:hypothetical protein
MQLLVVVLAEHNDRRDRQIKFCHRSCVGIECKEAALTEIGKHISALQLRDR